MSSIAAILAVLGIFHTIRIYAAGRAASRQHVPVNYTAQPGSSRASWRWQIAEENLDLKIIDDNSTSRIEFPPKFNFTDYFITLIGAVTYLAAVSFALFALWSYLFGGPESEGQVFAGFFLGGLSLFIGAVALAVRPRVTTLIRSKDKLSIEYTYGTFLRRLVSFSMQDKVTFKVKQQSITDYDISQALPFYELNTAKKSFVSMSPVKFYIVANQAQITWLQGGLTEWFSSINIDANSMAV